MLGSGEQPDVPDRQFGGRGTDEEYEEAKRRRTMNGFIGQAASAGGSPNDDVHYNSETGETQVVTTDDDHDNLFVDGKFIGISGQGAWKHYASDAAIYDSYSADFYRDAYGLNLNDKIYMRGYLTTRMATRA